MKTRWIRVAVVLFLAAITIPFLSVGQVQASFWGQLPTGSIPTVTSSPVNTYIIVNADQDQINVRSFPSAASAQTKVGVLLAGQQVPAVGRYGEWIQIVYPGVAGGLAWVHSPNVTVFGGTLPEIEPPPTPTPLYTMTIDPTLAAQFVFTIGPTRLPTFTQPAPLAITTYEASTKGLADAIPVGIFIVALGLLGLFLGFISLIRGR